jgi:uncharacterized protein (TIGR03435 family)
MFANSSLRILRLARRSHILMVLKLASAVLAGILTYPGRSALAQPCAANSRAQGGGTTAATLTFDVASVKPASPGDLSWKMEFSANGFIARNVTLKALTQEAYNAYDPGKLTGGPAWLDREKFDVNAKLDPGDIPNYKSMQLAERRAMLQALLTERFHLGVHCEVRIVPVVALKLEPTGLKLKPSTSTDKFNASVNGYESVVTRSAPGLIEGHNFSLQEFAHLLEMYLSRIVVDETGVMVGPAASERQSDNAMPSLVSALKELGLGLKSEKAPAEVLVVDSASQPTAD